MPQNVLRVSFALLLMVSSCLFMPTGCAQPQASEEPAQDFQVENFRWTGTLKAGQLLRAVNHYGNLRIRSSGNDEVVVSAMIQKLSDPNGQVSVHIDSDEERFFIRVGPAQAMGSRTEAYFNGRVDLSVLVPDGVSVDASTLDGLIEVKGVTGSVDARSTDGDLHLVRTGHLTAKTRHGNIQSTLRSGDSDKPQSLASVDGDIRVQIPMDFHLTIQARTTGPLVADFAKEFPVSINRGDDSLDAVLGNGTNSLYVTSDSAKIELVGTVR